MSRTIRKRPLFREVPNDRRTVARTYMGKDVRVTVWPFREKPGTPEATPPRVYVGRVVAVAIPDVGSVADFIVLATPGHYEQALSLSRVATIDLATGGDLAAQAAR